MRSGDLCTPGIILDLHVGGQMAARRTVAGEWREDEPVLELHATKLKGLEEFRVGWHCECSGG